MVPRTVLIACEAFDRLSAQQVGAAIAEGLAGGGWQTELCPLALEADLRSEGRRLLDSLDLDARMRRGRAVVLAPRRLPTPTPAESATFEIATRARQGGVPAYAVTAQNMLDPFHARMFDLQFILEASSRPALQAAGRKLARLI
jgi:glycerate 2-kinase